MLVFFAALALSAVPKLELARENEHGLPGMYYGSMDAADFDGDGLLDLVLSGNFDTVFDSGRHSDADAPRLSDRVRVYENVSNRGGAIRFRLKEERKDLYGSRGS